MKIKKVFILFAFITLEETEIGEFVAGGKDEIIVPQLPEKVER